MQQEQPQFYASLAAHLNAEEQTIIQSVFAQAEANILMSQQAQATGLAASPVAPGSSLNGGAS